jgi:hypothetical protein
MPSPNGVVLDTSPETLRIKMLQNLNFSDLFGPLCPEEPIKE